MGPNQPLRSSSHVPDNHLAPLSSYESVNFYSGPGEYIQPRASEVAELSISPWLHKVSQDGSPLSRTSSLGGPDFVSKPQYVEQGPLCYQLGQPLPFAVDNMTSQPHWIDSVYHTQSHLTGGDGWSVPSLLPSWHRTIYEGVHWPTKDHCIPQFITSESSSFSQLSQNHYPVRQTTDSAPLTPSDKTSSDDSNYGGDSSTCVGPHSSKSKYKDTTFVLKLGKWSNANDPFTHVEPRPYVCDLPDKKNPYDRMCYERFLRPEHLRRHRKTVHGNARPYICGVPQCAGAFSRGDNLRDHYWTHLSRGGRVGHNEKMSLEELKIILGPREKKLIKKLKRRLAEQRCKQNGHKQLYS
jgi:hypothetical protein